ncbi:MAG: hypothetical protein E2O44_02075 [Nitrospina sp.]|nr:MAG: hypothetical protein E2O44_02075 [Nitrospina sp.]TDJ61339.1 MAG: hypothetical protein E2O41_00695 [Nitrospina sp.]
METTVDVLLHARRKDLEAVAEKLSIEIETCNLSDQEIPIRSGHCNVAGQDRIYLDKNLSLSQQIETLLEILEKFDLESIYVAAWIREQLEQNRNNTR